MNSDEMTPAADPMPAFMEALSAFQAEMEVVTKSKSANAGRYKYTYADYADIMRTARSLFGKYGLSFSCSPQVVDRTIILTGMLMHKAGGYIEGTMPVTMGPPQQIGSDLSYMRRYLLTSLAGIATDDEDDEMVRNMPSRQHQWPGSVPEQPAPKPAPLAVITTASELAHTAGYAPQMLAKLVDWVTQGRTTDLAKMTEEEAAVFISKTRQKLQEQAPAGEQTEPQEGDHA